VLRPVLLVVLVIRVALAERRDAASRRLAGGGVQSKLNFVWVSSKNEESLKVAA